MRIPGGSFTTDGGAWLDAPPRFRSELTLPQLADLLRLEIDRSSRGDGRAAGDPPAWRAAYGFAGAQDVLCDLHLAAGNAVRGAESRAGSAERAGAYARVAVARVWRLLGETGRRKTMRTADVRAAVEPDEAAVAELLDREPPSTVPFPSLRDVADALAETYDDDGVAMALAAANSRFGGHPLIRVCRTGPGRAQALEWAQSMTGQTAT